VPLSPDVPAWINYLVVLASGVFVAITTVNTLLDDQPDRWAFSGTWILALAHVAIPPLLLWFLDYTEVVHDTSFFVALIVGFGYRQVFQGGVQGITISGQTPALWKPFEAWVQRAIQGISVESKQYRDRFDDRSKRRIAADPAPVSKLDLLATAYSADPPKLAANVNAARALFTDQHLNTVLTDLFWDDLRQSKPLRYAYLLRDDGLVSGWRVWWWFDKGRSKTVISIVLLACLVAAKFVGPLGINKSEPLFLMYNQWRVLKRHATERDRFRSVAYLDARLSSIDSSIDDAAKRHAARTAAAQDLKRPPIQNAAQIEARDEEEAFPTPTNPLEGTLGRLLNELKFSELPETTADRIVGLVLRSRSAIRDDKTVQDLIGGLWTESGAVRARINRGLVQIQKKAYADHPLPEELTTAPQSGEAFEAIDRRVRAWLDWWEKRLQPQKPASEASTPIVAGVVNGRYVVEVPFASNSADRPTELNKPLEELGMLLKENAGWHLRVEGHTDNIGSAAANLDLSERRATTIVKFLTDDQGVPDEQLTVRAVGEGEPRASNETEEGRQKNRRVELLRTDGEFSKLAGR